MIDGSRWRKSLVVIAAMLLAASACSSQGDDPTPLESSTSTAAAESVTAAETTIPPDTTAPSTSTTKRTTTMPPTTATTSSSTTTTRPPTTTTSVQPPADNEPPTVEIISPDSLSSHSAVYDASTERFGAAVALSAAVSDPNGDRVNVEWYSSDEGYLGSGESITAMLHTGNFDSAQPRITARAIDQWNTAAEATVQIIVWIPSDS